jgi:hypothetical protein
LHLHKISPWHAHRLERRQENHLLPDIVPENVANIQCILKTIIQVGTQLSLVLANKLQAVMFRTCIRVNNELLQKPSDSQNPFFVDVMMQHVRIKLKHGDARIPLKSIQWDAVMPSVASI